MMVIFLYVEPLFINWRAGWLRTIERVEAVSARTTSRPYDRALPRYGGAGRRPPQLGRYD